MKSCLVFLIVFFTALWVATFGFEPVNFKSYIAIKQIQRYPIYTVYLRLGEYPLALPISPLIRQPYKAHPGDYFWPPDTYSYRRLDISAKLDASETHIISEFLKNNCRPKILGDSAALASIVGYAYDYPRFRGLRREAYAMFSEGDTVYVVSGWLGKFLSFYRVVPGDFRLDSHEFMKELEKLTPLSNDIKVDKFRHESDSINYLWEYVDKEKMFRVRNYLMKTALPPSPPDPPDGYYNLIEVTRFYDKEVIP